jgi:hypothetical protein
MTYRIAGIDVHKKMLAVVIAEIAETGEYQFERCRFGATPEQRKRMAAWLIEREAREAVMESTAQYWRPVWETLERYWQPVCRQREGAGPEAQVTETTWRRRATLRRSAGPRSKFSPTDHCRNRTRSCGLSQCRRPCVVGRGMPRRQALTAPPRSPSPGSGRRRSSGPQGRLP